MRKIIGLTIAAAILMAGTAYAKGCKYPSDFRKKKYYEINTKSGQTYKGQLYKTKGDCSIVFRLPGKKDIGLNFNEISTYMKIKKSQVSK